MSVFTLGDMAFLAASAGGGAFESETDTLLAAFSGSYDSARQTAINTLIKALKDDGIWAKLDVLRIAGLNEADSLINWKSPGTWNSTAVNSPSFVADRGFTSSSSGTRYINTNFIPSTAGGNFSTNSAHLGVYSRTNVARFGYDLGVSQNSPARASSLLSRFTDGNCYHRINTAIEPPDPVANSQGFFVTSRTTSTLTTLYQNGSSVGTKSDGSASPNSIAIFEGTQNDNGTPQNAYSERELAAITIGGGLTGTEAANYNTALVAYLTYIGANV